MSFIVGINLSDRVLLSSDTRLTFETAKAQKYLDTLFKIKPLSQEIAVVVAGSAKMASFIVKGILASDINKKNIREFRNNIDNLIRELTDKYQVKYKKFYENVCFIFAGINKKAKKIIDFKRYIEITKEFQDKTNASMNMKDVVFRALKEGKNNLIKIQASDSHVFCVKISPKKFTIEDVEWGEFVAYGAGLTKENLPKRFFGQFETALNSGDYSNNKIWFDIFIKDTAEKNKKSVIGGGITSMMISDKTSGLLLGETWRLNIRTGIKEIFSVTKIIDKKPHCLINNKMERLTSFIHYEDMLLESDFNVENCML